MSQPMTEIIETLKTNHILHGITFVPKGTAFWAYIDKPMAENILEHNLNVRSINQNGVKEYEQEMKSGLWRVNGEPIIIDDNGKLRNGQHRLNAVVRSSVGIWTLIVYDVPADQCDIYDVQMKRTLKQMHGGDATSSALTLAARLACGIGVQKIASGLALQYYNAHSETLEKSVKLTRYASKKPIGNKTGCQIATYIWVKKGQYEEMLEKFFKILNSGINIDGYESSAPLVLRRQLSQLSKSNMSNSTYMSVIADITYSAIKDFISGNARTKNYKVDNKYLKELESVL